MIEIIDLGTSSVLSIRNALSDLTSAEIKVIRTASESNSPQLFVLPGNGHFGAASLRLHESGIGDLLRTKTSGTGTKMLGICLGMQLMGSGSEESEQNPGLGLIQAKVMNLSRKNEGAKLPHIGWASVRPASGSFADIPEFGHVFYSHSFAYMPNDMQGQSVEVLISSYAGAEFVAGFRSESLVGYQFHPEKSSKLGSVLLGSSLRWASIGV